MKKTVCLLLIFSLLLCLCGCGGSAKEAGSFTADNEIVTYRQLDSAKTTLVISLTGNLFLDDFAAAFEEKNPDVQVVVLDITGGNDKSKPVTAWVKNGSAPDVMFVRNGTFSNEQSVEYFESLSALPVLEYFEADALNRQDMDGNIYWLPGSSQVDCMTINKTLFKEYGWETPVTLDDFVNLCVKIREDTNGAIVPWNPNAKYSNEFNTVTEGFMYEELFGGVSNRTWYNDFLKGKATFAGHMEPYYEMLQTLIDNGLLTEEHFSYSATTRGKEFADGKIAMINYRISDIQSDEYEFEFIPFPASTGTVGYVSSSFNCVVGIPKKEHTKAQKNAIDRFIAFFASVEGQEAFIGDSLEISNIKGVPKNESPALAPLSPALDAGHLFERLEFESDLGLTNFSLCSDALAMVKGEKTAAQCIAAVDAQPFVRSDGSGEAPEAVAQAEEDFTILETSELLADMYREAAGADIGLIENNVAFRGNLMKIFAGEINSADVTVLKPRSLENESTLVKLSMTGQQLLDALNSPLGNEQTADCVYAFSGLKCTVAPWKPLGERYLSATLADGTAIDSTALYTVACWAGTVADEYITETVQSYEGSFEELMTAYLTAAKTISPAKDGRMTLVWE